MWKAIFIDEAGRRPLQTLPVHMLFFRSMAKATEYIEDHPSIRGRLWKSDKAITQGSNAGWELYCAFNKGILE